ncbi:MAG: hypothetical protein IJU51_04105 [Clostridia bacterium]|nr:hypothetical protein [Clostridia bacterium]
MKKTKILGIAIAAAMITSAASMTAFADKFAESADIKKAASVGITGSFCDWGGEDVSMTDDDGDGVYEGTIVIDSVTEGMISESMEDKGPEEGKVSRGFSGVQFKIRTDGTWDNSWGDYEAAYNRTYNSQTNCCVEATVGAPLTIKVKLDTNKVVDQSGVESEDDRYEDGADDAFNAWVVSYEKVDAPVEESSEESSETPVEESSETPAEESSETPAEESSSTPVEESSEDSKTVDTGDTTSAVALVAVVMASLAVAVVMTKKASSKE